MKSTLPEPARPEAAAPVTYREHSDAAAEGDDGPDPNDLRRHADAPAEGPA